MKQLNSLEKSLLDRAFEGIELCSELVYNEATSLVLVASGDLKNSIYYKSELDGNDIVGIVGTNIDYAPIVEFGNDKNTPMPFLYPALSNSRNKIYNLLAYQLKRRL